MKLTKAGKLVAGQLHTQSEKEQKELKDWMDEEEGHMVRIHAFERQQLEKEINFMSHLPMRPSVRLLNLKSSYKALVRLKR